MSTKDATGEKKDKAASAAQRQAKLALLRAVWDRKELRVVSECLAALRAQGAQTWSHEDAKAFGTTPLIEATKNPDDNVELIEMLAEWCAADEMDEKGNAALGFCAGRGKSKSVKFLVSQAGANVNLTGDQGLAPIHVAAGAGNLEIVRFLSQFKPLPLTDTYRKTALHLATEHGNADCARFLLDHCNPDAQSTLRQTALDIAIKNDCAEIAALLAPVSELGSWHEHQFSYEMHALLAASEGSVNCVSLFLTKMWASRDLNGKTALDLVLEGPATRRKTQACLEVLERDAPLDIGREALAKHGEDELPVLFARVEADDLRRAVEAARIGAPMAQDVAAGNLQETARKEKANKKRL